MLRKIEKTTGMASEPKPGWSKSEDSRRLGQEAIQSMIEGFQEDELRAVLKNTRIEDLDDGFFWGMALASAASNTESHGCLRALIEAGVEIDAPIDEGYTALSRSADADNAAAIHALCDLGANHSAREECGRTPLLLAANCGHEAAIEALVKRGAAVAVKDMSARSPVDLLLSAAEWKSKPQQRESCARSLVILLKAGARSTRIANMSMMAQIALAGNPAMIAGAVDTGAVEVDDASESGLTALMCCARSEIFPSESCVSALLALGARTDLVDARGLTALDYAVQADNHSIAQRIREAAAAREALALGLAAERPRLPQARRFTL